MSGEMRVVVEMGNSEVFWVGLGCRMKGICDLLIASGKATRRFFFCLVPL